MQPTAPRARISKRLHQIPPVVRLRIDAACAGQQNWIKRRAATVVLIARNGQVEIGERRFGRTWCGALLEPHSTTRHRFFETARAFGSDLGVSHAQVFESLELLETRQPVVCDWIAVEDQRFEAL